MIKKAIPWIVGVFGFGLLAVIFGGPVIVSGNVMPVALQSEQSFCSAQGASAVEFQKHEEEVRNDWTTSVSAAALNFPMGTLSFTEANQLIIKQCIDSTAMHEKVKNLPEPDWRLYFQINKSDTAALAKIKAAQDSELSQASACLGGLVSFRDADGVTIVSNQYATDAITFAQQSNWMMCKSLANVAVQYYQMDVAPVVTVTP